ncbi:DUF1961 family protein [Puniceicoccus vermicola]|uniref:DUF1961 family protein n=1 Tax=Puniceicoccus vermicola TaxID=388746 RepID=A0A7X1AXC5_9BACT|nr:DUF1961 family protein [Puniceicoccus vermicola]MBC2601711.1 DUF1961 family protein [Puniceicoccus vermicola]
MRLLCFCSLCLISTAGLSRSESALEKSPSSTIVLVGDSTVVDALSSRDQAGWGWALSQMAKPGVKVINTAKGGRSSRSFRTEGRWDDALSYDADWVLIQFGHNDQPGKGPERASDAKTEYREHLRQYIAEARESGARVVLLTPVARRTFDSQGNLRDSLAPYAESVRIVGEETGTLVLDLHARSTREYLAMGEPATDRLGPPHKAVDRTHFSKDGSRLVASWVFEMLAETSPELAESFDPSRMVVLEPILRIRTPGMGVDGVTEIPGPFEDVAGAMAMEGVVEVSANLDAKTKMSSGTLGFWFYVDRDYQSAPGNEQWKETLVSSPKVIDLSVGLWPQFWGMFMNWRGPYDFGGYMRIQTPRINGPRWHHLAVVWDTDKGLQNLYFDGRPSGADLPRFEPGMEAPVLERIVARLLPDIGISEVRLYDKPLNEEEINSLLSAQYSGQSDHLLGAEDLGEIQVSRDKLSMVYENAMTRPEDSKDWIMEGPGKVEYTAEGMVMESTRPERSDGHIVYWLDRRLPENFVAEWEVEILSEYGLNIVFFSATGPDGVSVFDQDVTPRDGDFKQYHGGDIDCYHISYYADSEANPGRSTANLRKNSGFYLVSNGPEGIPPESTKTHRVVLSKVGGRIQLAVDGQLSIDWQDDGASYGEVLGAGWFGLRQMRWTKAIYRNLRIYAIDED